MDLDLFRSELEQRLLMAKEYLIQELSSIDDDQERLELLGKFNDQYKELTKRIANENRIDLNAQYQSGDFSYEKIILGKTMDIYDKLADELYEEITSAN
ncbi:hypothetical protein CEY12_17425 [Chryseobacterium sp. T16E-39]|nr:hypothetical protein CEY12_17425 [Chryseobacterium sp. T16E-39]